MNRYLRFYLAALVFSAWPYYMAFSGDTFSTAIVSLPAIFFFISSSIYCLVRAIRKKDTASNLIKFFSALILLVSWAMPLVLSDSGLGELTNRLKARSSIFIPSAVRIHRLALMRSPVNIGRKPNPAHQPVAAAFAGFVRARGETLDLAARREVLRHPRCLHVPIELNPTPNNSPPTGTILYIKSIR